MTELFGPAMPRIRRIIEATASYYGIKVANLMGTERHRRFTEPRQIVHYLVREITGLSYPNIGMLTDRHHTTIMHSCQKVGAHAADPDVRAMLDALTEQATEPDKPAKCAQCVRHERAIARLTNGFHGCPVAHVERIYHARRKAG